MTEDDFYATIKFKSGEEIFALVGYSEEEDRTFLLLESPITIQRIKNRNGNGVGEGTSSFSNRISQIKRQSLGTLTPSSLGSPKNLILSCIICNPPCKNKQPIGLKKMTLAQVSG